MTWSVDPRWDDFIFAALRYIAPALLGIAQGVVLVRMLGRVRNLGIWVATNVLAFVVAIQLTPLVLAGTYFELQSPSAYVVTVTLFGAFYGAITGAVLVAMSARAAARAPAPAARLPLAPRP